MAKKVKAGDRVTVIEDYLRDYPLACDGITLGAVYTVRFVPRPSKWGRFDMYLEGFEDRAFSTFGFRPVA